MSGSPPQLIVTYGAVPTNDTSTGPPSAFPADSANDGKPVMTRSKPPSGRIRDTAPVSP
jgi:hypothetical protein